MATKPCRMLRYRAAITVCCRKNGPMNVFEDMTDQNVTFAECNDNGTEIRKFVFTQILFVYKAIEIKINFLGKSNRSHVCFGTIALLKKVVLQDLFWLAVQALRDWWNWMLYWNRFKITLIILCVENFWSPLSIAIFLRDDRATFELSIKLLGHFCRWLMHAFALRFLYNYCSGFQSIQSLQTNVLS